MTCCDAGVVSAGTAYVEARFWNPATGALESPSAVTFTTKDPTGTEVSFSTPSVLITEQSTGVFVFAMAIPFGATSEGRWYVRARGTGGLLTEGEITFVVPVSPFT